MTWLARILGVATVVYSVVVLVRPGLLAVPTGLVRRGEAIPGPVGSLARAVGARDTAIGLAMVFAPATTALAYALGARIVSDFSDAVIFGAGALDQSARRKTIGVAVGWGVLNVIALLLVWAA